MNIGLSCITIAQILGIFLLVFAVVVKKKQLRYLYIWWLSFQIIFFFGWLYFLNNLLK